MSQNGTKQSSGKKHKPPSPTSSKPFGVFWKMAWIFGSVTVAIISTVLASAQLSDPLDIGKTIVNKRPGECSLVPGIENGALDVVIIPGTTIAIMTTGVQFNRMLTKPGVPSQLIAIDISAPNSSLKPLRIVGHEGPFNMQGLSILQTRGQTFVYVGNHPPYNEHPPADEIFKLVLKLDEGVLEFQKSFSDPAIVQLDNLLVLEEDKFYVSNFRTTNSLLSQNFEALLGLINIPMQNVVFYDGTVNKATVVIDKAFVPEGMGFSRDKKYLYVNEFGAKRVNSYLIESLTKLTLVDRRSVNGSPDNLDVDPTTGDIWLAANPLFWKVAMAGFTGQGGPPSLVQKFEVRDGKFISSKEVFVDDGGMISISSSAVRRGPVLFIGSGADTAVVCRCGDC